MFQEKKSRKERVTSFLINLLIYWFLTSFMAWDLLWIFNNTAGRIVTVFIFLSLYPKEGLLEE